MKRWELCVLANKMLLDKVIEDDLLFAQTHVCTELSISKSVGARVNRHSCERFQHGEGNEYPATILSRMGSRGTVLLFFL